MLMPSCILFITSILVKRSAKITRKLITKKLMLLLLSHTYLDYNKNLPTLIYIFCNNFTKKRKIYPYRKIISFSADYFFFMISLTIQEAIKRPALAGTKTMLAGVYPSVSF